MSEIVLPDIALPALDADATALVPDRAARSPYAPLLFLLPMGMAWFSWISGGVPRLTDIAMGALSLICVGFVWTELRHFAQRFSIAGLILYGGILVWYSHDYFSYWAGVDFAHDELPHAVPSWAAAKLAFLICILTFFASYAARSSFGSGIVRFISRLPESGGDAYFVVTLLLCLLGLVPFFFFVNEPFYVAMWKAMYVMRAEENIGWTVQRSGNLNYDMSAYFLYLWNAGFASGTLAGFHLLWMARSPLTRVVDLLILAFWLAVAFGTGARSQVIFVGMPLIGLLFIRYHTHAAALLRRFSKRAYLYSAAALVATLLVVQIQIHYRNAGMTTLTLQDVSVTTAQGNCMFTEGLTAVTLVPEQKPFFHNKFIIDGAAWYLWDKALFFAVHPIPRALWPTKPIDPAWEWYNEVNTGEGRNGTTTTAGLAASAYISYGLCGAIVNALLLGWLLGLADRLMYRGLQRPLQLFLALGMAMWLFQSFRGEISYTTFWALVLPLGMMGLLLHCLRAAGVGRLA